MSPTSSPSWRVACHCLEPLLPCYLTGVHPFLGPLAFLHLIVGLELIVGGVAGSASAGSLCQVERLCWVLEGKRRTAKGLLPSTPCPLGSPFPLGIVYLILATPRSAGLFGAISRPCTGASLDQRNVPCNQIISIWLNPYT